MGGGGSTQSAVHDLNVSAPSTSGAPGAASIKCVVVGDHGIGKSSLISTYVTSKFPDEAPSPTTNDNFNVFLQAGDQPTQLGIWDTVGSADHDRLRPLSYASSEVFLICFSTTDKEAGDRVVKKWYPEVRYHAALTPVVIVGLRTDERTEGGITTEMGQKIAGKCGKGTRYVECSAKQNQNVKAVFDAAVSVAVTGQSKPSAGKKKKPVIYLYPETETPVKVTVVVKNDDKLSSLYPEAAPLPTSTSVLSRPEVASSVATNEIGA